MYVHFSTKPVLDIKVAFDIQSHESKSNVSCCLPKNIEILQFKLLYITLEFLLFNNLMFYLHIIIGVVKSLYTILIILYTYMYLGQANNNNCSQIAK